MFGSWESRIAEKKLWGKAWKDQALHQSYSIHVPQVILLELHAGTARTAGTLTAWFLNSFILEFDSHLGLEVSVCLFIYLNKNIFFWAYFQGTGIFENDLFPDLYTLRTILLWNFCFTPFLFPWWYSVIYGFFYCFREEIWKEPEFCFFEFFLSKYIWNFLYSYTLNVLYSFNFAECACVQILFN